MKKQMWFQENEGKEAIYKNWKERGDLEELKGKREFEGTEEKEVI
jgi:hypothetical protein